MLARKQSKRDLLKAVLKVVLKAVQKVVQKLQGKCFSMVSLSKRFPSIQACQLKI